MKAIAIVLAACIVSGCSVTRFGNTFEGANDFRIVPAFDAGVAAPAECTVTAGTRTNDNPGDANRRGVNLGCYSRFQNHPAAGSNPTRFFQPQEQIAIFLKTTRFAFFTEGWAEILSNRAFGSPVKGEVAIVANVTQGARSPGGIGTSGQLEGKVVFYSGDVYLGQLANEFNVPIYGPERWNGGPLTIDIWALELDEAESKQYGPILKTLSSLSSKLIGIPGTGQQVLNQVGTAFLNSNRDDVIGHVTMTLVPPQPGSTLPDPILQVSDIIVQRNENGADRSSGVPFDDCYYEPLQAKVYCPAPRGGGFRPPDRNSFILSIRRAATSTQLVSDVTLSQLNGRLQGATSLAEVNAIIEENADATAARARSQGAQQALVRIADTSTPAAVRDYDADQVLGTLQCALIADRVNSSVPADAPAWRKSYAEACGGTSTRRAIDMDEFNLIGRKMVAMLAFDASMLSGDRLVGTVKAPDVAALRALRSNLVQYATPRP